MGLALAHTGRLPEAVAHYQAALEILPDAPEAHRAFGMALADQGKIRDAIAHFREALRLKPDDVETLDELSWALATYPEDVVRDGKEAVQLATHAVQLTGGQNMATVDTLAAAYAEAGRFEEAIRTEQKAVEFAAASRQPQLAEEFRRRLKLYQSGRAYRTAP
jgi:tetratricopeptide (TPR) repeat protein